MKLNLSISSPATACLALDLHVAELQLVLLPIAQVQLTADHHAYILFRNQRRAAPRIPKVLSMLCRGLGLSKHLFLAPLTEHGAFGLSWNRNSNSTEGMSSVLGSVADMESTIATMSVGAPSPTSQSPNRFAPLHGRTLIAMQQSMVRSSAELCDIGGSTRQALLGCVMSCLSNCCCIR